MVDQKWQHAYRLSDNLLLFGGCMEVRVDPQFNAQACGVVELDGPPPIGHTHYNGNGGTRLPSAPEAAAIAESKTDGEAVARVDEKAIKAAVICSLWGRLNRQPTGPEIQAERTRFIQIYKAL